MATGDQSNILARILRTLPTWFGSSAGLLAALLDGLAWAGSFVYSLIDYTRLQTRIKTATDAWLDLIALDFFGDSLRRYSGQSDASFRSRIIINLFRERATRAAVISVLKDLTGRTPIVVEPARPADTGCYGGPTIGYGVAGAYGSLLLPYQAFVTAFRPAGTGVPKVGPYGLANYGATLGNPGGYGVASEIEYASLSMIQGDVTDADIAAAVDSVKPAATIIWLRIQN